MLSAVLWHRLDDGELSDDEKSTDTAPSDVDDDDSFVPASSTAVSSDTRDKRREVLHEDDDNSDIADRVSKLPDMEPKMKTKSPVDTMLPSVRLERLAVETSKKDMSTAAVVEVIPSKQTPASEHNYFSTSEPPPAPPPDDRGESYKTTDVVSAEPPASVPTLPQSIAIDHCYCVPFLPSLDDVLPSPVAKAAVIGPTQRRRKRRLTDVTNVSGSRELSSILPPVAVISPPRPPQYQPRDLKSEIMTLLEFILAGVDAEDMMFLRRRYEQLLQFDSTETDWLNDTHWVDHPPTFFIDQLPQPPPRKRRKANMLDDHSGHHVTGQAVFSLLCFHLAELLSGLADFCQKPAVVETGLKRCSRNKFCQFLPLQTLILIFLYSDVDTFMHFHTKCKMLHFLVFM